MNHRIESLLMVERAFWRELDRAAQDAAHEWHVLTLATVDVDRADARSVVLREVDEQAHTLLFYTDLRSPKVAQLRRHPQATLLAWSRTLAWQLRLQVSLTLLDSGLEVSSRWAKMKLSPSAQDYLAPLPPGTPLPLHAPDRDTRQHFGVVRAQVDGIDWTELHADGHRRARFDARGSLWLTP